MRSPGVDVDERDLSQRIPAVSTSVGAIPIIATKGPVNEVVPINSEKDYVQTFGAPTGNELVYKSFYSATGYLEWGNQLRVVRVEGDEASAASIATEFTGTIGDKDFTADDFPVEWSDVEDDSTWDPSTDWILYVISIGPGTYYNDVSVVAINDDDFAALENFDRALSNATSSIHRRAVAEAYYKGWTDSDNDGEHGDGNVVIKVPPKNPADDPKELKFGIGKEGPNGEIYPKPDGTLAGSNLLDDVITETIEGSEDPDDGDPTSENNDIYEPDGSTVAEYIGFEYAPDTNKEFVLHVYDANDSLAESYLCSSDPDAKDYRNKSIFCQNVVNEQSELINAFVDEDEAIPGSLSKTSLGAGQSGDNDHGTEDSPNEPTGNILQAINSVFGNIEEIDIDLMIDPDMSDAVKREMDQICQQRMDCFAVLSMPEFATDDVDEMKEYVEDDLNINSSYSAIYGNYFRKYDTYNDQYRWMPVAGDIAGLFARTDDIVDPWWATAGDSRGRITGVDKVMVNPKKADRDILYSNRINPIVDFPDRGIEVFGQKTLQAQASAFDRINVRRLFIVVETAIRRFARSFLFEFNDAQTRSRFVSQVSSYLEGIKGRRGVYDYKVVADDTINTPQVIDRNEFKANIYLKPTRAIEFIELTFIATSTGIDFEEVISQ